MTLDPNRNLAHPPLPPVPEKLVPQFLDVSGHNRLVVGSVMAELWRLEAYRLMSHETAAANHEACTNAQAWRRWAGLEVENG